MTFGCFQKGFFNQIFGSFMINWTVALSDTGSSPALVPGLLSRRRLPQEKASLTPGRGVGGATRWWDTEEWRSDKYCFSSNLDSLIWIRNLICLRSCTRDDYISLWFPCVLDVNLPQTAPNIYYGQTQWNVFKYSTGGIHVYAIAVLLMKFKGEQASTS